MTQPGAAHGGAALARAPANFLRLALEGERTRKAVAACERESHRLIAALRRAVPFLSRRGLAVSLLYAQATPFTDVVGTLKAPFFAVHVTAKPGNARGVLLLDAGANAMLLDGVLGGNGQSIPTLNAAGLTSPQTALVSGLASGIARAFSECLFGAIGVMLEVSPPPGDDAAADSCPIACALEFGANEQVGRVILLLPKEVLLAEPAVATTATLDPRIAAVLEQVEVEIVAELARVRMKVSELVALKVGDTLRLDVPVNGTVTVRAGEKELLRGKPTTLGGRIAVRVGDAGVADGKTRHEG
jgi:flagellar motor switch protein FliM